MADKVFRVRLDPVPDKFKTDDETWRFLNQLRDRVGGNSGSFLYDGVQDANTAAALEPLVFAVNSAVQSDLEGQVRSIIEQIQEQTIDISGLLTETAPIVQDPLQPEDFFPISGIIQQSIASAPVQSVFGRSGAVLAADGDYVLNLLGDVTISAPSTNQVLSFNGTVWVNSAVPAGALSGIVPVANGGTGVSSLIANSVILGNGTSAVSSVAPGTSGNVLTSNGTTWQSATPTAVVTAPQYEEIVAAAGQTVFNTTVSTLANGSGRSYLMVTLNGLVMREGGTNDYTVTGATQVTFTFALVLNDVVTFRSFT